jgi:hypothetical protein
MAGGMTSFPSKLYKKGIVFIIIVCYEYFRKRNQKHRNNCRDLSLI